MPTSSPVPLEGPNIVEDVPPNIRERQGRHGDTLAPIEGTLDVDLRAPWLKLALALAVGYGLGFAVHGR